MKQPDPQSKTIRTIKKVLEEVFNQGYNKCLDSINDDIQEKEIVDQALSDISKIIDDAKPDLTNTYSSVAYHDAFTKGVDQYLHNLKERLG